jgi:nicotinamidase-related amidase
MDFVLNDFLGDTFTSNPQLASQLQASGISTIVAFGIQSECCVLSTCLGALAAGFKLILLSGAHSTYSTSDKSSETIERDVESQLARSGAQIVPWEVWKPSAS